MKPEKPFDVLRLIDKEIDVCNSKVLFDQAMTPGNIDSVFNTYNSDWSVVNSWFTGKNTNESAGMAIIRQDFPGNVLLEFECRTVLPSTHDINFMWNCQWDDILNSCGSGYIGSICGWWTKKAGIEKSPDFKLRATTSGFSFEPGRTYRVQAGSIEGNCFLFIDGKLYVELNDPDPLDTLKYNKVALSAYSSWVQFKNITVRQITWNYLKMSYKSEF